MGVRGGGGARGGGRMRGAKEQGKKDGSGGARGGERRRGRRGGVGQRVAGRGRGGGGGVNRGRRWSRWMRQGRCHPVISDGLMSGSITNAHAHRASALSYHVMFCVTKPKQRQCSKNVPCFDTVFYKAALSLDRQHFLQ